MAGTGKIENLKSYKKGQCGNPNGRPRKLPQLDVLLADVLGEEKNGITEAEKIIKALKLKASKGDVKAAELLLDRAYGKLKQNMDLNIPQPITINYNNQPGNEPLTDGN